MKHLIIFSIGPVQDFIATARRSRDLWYGSWMLSELARAAAKEVINNSGNLIFPADPENIVSVPNKIVATVQDPDEVAVAIKAAINKRMKELCDESLERIKSIYFNKHKALAIKQIEDLPELYWVSVPYDENGYKAAREEAEALLAARKITRNFTQTVGGYVPKSSLDGARESVIDEQEYPRKDESEQEKEDKIRFLYENYRARQGERLSGVDLLKRLGGAMKEPDFRSTSHMAAIPFMEQLGVARKDTLVSEIRNVFAIATWGVNSKDEGSLLFENRILELMPAGKKQKDSIKSLNEIIKKAAGNDSLPNPYYALLAADGDNMGKVIDNQDDEESHRNLSEALSSFAEKVAFIVNNEEQKDRDPEKDNKGMLIYSGGDDVLAYLPINTALRCAGELEKEFRNSLAGFSATEKADGKDIPVTPTLSIGIVIAHHLDPLSDVLEMARAAEKKAKEIKGKNGLAITLSKRSGVDRTIKGKWAELSNRLDGLIKFFDAKLISGGTAYELHRLHRTLAGHIPDEGLAAEAMRIIKHKQEAGGGEALEEVRKTIRQWVREISLNELANQMIIARALADSADFANIKEEA